MVAPNLTAGAGGFGTRLSDEDIARVLDIWQASLGSGGPFLLGELSIADFMFFPVATRFRTYGVPLPELAARYQTRLLELPIARELERLAAGQPVIEREESALYQPR